jgi:hypothetical protein
VREPDADNAQVGHAFYQYCQCPSRNSATRVNNSPGSA